MMKKRLRIWKLSFLRWCGFVLSGSETADLNYWITLHRAGKLTKLASKALGKLRKGKSVVFDDDIKCELIRWLVRKINMDKRLLKMVRERKGNDVN